MTNFDFVIVGVCARKDNFHKKYITFIFIHPAVIVIYFFHMSINDRLLEIKFFFVYNIQ